MRLVAEDGKSSHARPSRPSPGTAQATGKTGPRASHFLRIFEGATVALPANRLQTGYAHAFSVTCRWNFGQVVEQLGVRRRPVLTW
jgi:hypothetical protein